MPCIWFMATFDWHNCVPIDFLKQISFMCRSSIRANVETRPLKLHNLLQFLSPFPSLTFYGSSPSQAARRSAIHVFLAIIYMWRKRGFQSTKTKVSLSIQWCLYRDLTGISEEIEATTIVTDQTDGTVLEIKAMIALSLLFGLSEWQKRVLHVQSFRGCLWAYPPYFQEVCVFPMEPH